MPSDDETMRPSASYWKTLVLKPGAAPWLLPSERWTTWPSGSVVVLIWLPTGSVVVATTHTTWFCAGVAGTVITS